MKMKSHDFDIRQSAIITKDKKSGFLVGHIKGIIGAHSQAETLEELYQNLEEVLDLTKLDSQNSNL